MNLCLKELTQIDKVNKLLEYKIVKHRRLGRISKRIKTIAFKVVGHR